MLRSFTERNLFTLGLELGKVHEVYYPHLGSSFLSLSVSLPGYLLKGIPKQKRPWDFTVFDAGKKWEWVYAREDQNSLEGTLTTKVEASEEYETLAPATTSQCMMGLVLHKVSTDRIHVYGAVVWLDQADAGERIYNVLSGTHGGSVDVFVHNLGDNPPVKTHLGSTIGIRCRLVK